MGKVARMYVTHHQLATPMRDQVVGEFVERRVWHLVLLGDPDKLSQGGIMADVRKGKGEDLLDRALDAHGSQTAIYQAAKSRDEYAKKAKEPAKVTPRQRMVWLAAAIGQLDLLHDAQLYRHGWIYSIQTRDLLYPLIEELGELLDENK